MPAQGLRWCRRSLEGRWPLISRGGSAVHRRDVARTLNFGLLGILGTNRGRCPDGRGHLPTPDLPSCPTEHRGGSRHENVGSVGFGRHGRGPIDGRWPSVPSARGHRCVASSGGLAARRHRATQHAYAGRTRRIGADVFRRCLLGVRSSWSDASSVVVACEHVVGARVIGRCRGRTRVRGGGCLRGGASGRVVGWHGRCGGGWWRRRCRTGGGTSRGGSVRLG
jgi:hypothetical protein